MNDNTAWLNAARNTFNINPEYTLTFTCNDKLNINDHNVPYFIDDINSFRRMTLQLFRHASERGLASAPLPSSSNRHSASVPGCIVKTRKAVTSDGINTSIMVGYLSVSRRMNNTKKRRREKTTGELNRDTCSRRGGREKRRGEGA